MSVDLHLGHDLEFSMMLLVSVMCGQQCIRCHWTNLSESGRCGEENGCNKRGNENSEGENDQASDVAGSMSADWGGVAEFVGQMLKSADLLGDADFADLTNGGSVVRFYIALGGKGTRVAPRK